MRKLIAPILGFMFVEFIVWYGGVDIFQRGFNGAFFFSCSCIASLLMACCPYLPERYRLFNLF